MKSLTFFTNTSWWARLLSAYVTNCDNIRIFRLLIPSWPVIQCFIWFFSAPVCFVYLSPLRHPWAIRKYCSFISMVYDIGRSICTGFHQDGMALYNPDIRVYSKFRNWLVLLYFLRLRPHGSGWTNSIIVAGLGIKAAE